MALTKAQEAQKRQEKAFEQMIINAYAEKGETISPKRAHQIHLRDKKKSDSIRLARWKQYEEGDRIYKQKHGYNPEEGDRGIDETITLAPGEEVVSDKSQFKEEEKPLELKYDELKKENRMLREQIIQLIKALQENNVLLKKVLSRTNLDKEIKADLKTMTMKDKKLDDKINKRLKKRER